MKRLLQYMLVALAVVMMSAPVLAEYAALQPYLSAVEDDWYSYDCSSGSEEYDCVDDFAGGSDYLYTKAEQKRELFYLENLPGNAESVDYVEFWYLAKEYGPNNDRFGQYIYLDGWSSLCDDYDPWDCFSPDSTYRWYSYRWNVNPYSAEAWTVSEVNRLRGGFGTGNLPGVNYGARITSFYAYVKYDT